MKTLKGNLYRIFKDDLDIYFMKSYSTTYVTKQIKYFIITYKSCTKYIYMEKMKCTWQDKKSQENRDFW